MRPLVRRLLVPAALACTALLANPLAPAAEAADSGTYYLKSVDGGARVQVSLTFYSANHYAALWTNCDIRADNRGPIMFIYQQLDTMATNLNAYNHDLGGNKTCESKRTDVNRPEYITTRVIIQECNGGSQSAPRDCDVDIIKNPYVS